MHNESLNVHRFGATHQMSDPLTALMHAVQVMNLLKALILKTLRERDDAAAAEGDYSAFSSSPSSDRHGEDNELDSEQAMDTSGELKEVASDVCSQDDEHDAANGIEEWKGHVADLIRDSVSFEFSSSDQTTHWTCSDLNAESDPRTSDNELYAEARSKLKLMEQEEEEGQVEIMPDGLALYMNPC